MHLPPLTTDVTLRDGQVLPKDDANAIVRLLSDDAILGACYEQNENAINSTANTDRSIRAVSEYILDHRQDIADNTRPLYSYGNSSEYTRAMELAEGEISTALSDYQSAGSVWGNHIDAALDLYAQALNSYTTGRSDIGYYIGDALFYTDSLTITSNRTRLISYEEQFGRAFGAYSMAIKSILEDRGITSGSLYEYAQKDIVNLSAHPRSARDADCLDTAVRMYLELLDPETGTESPENEPSRQFWIQSGAEAGDGLWLKFGTMNTEYLGIDHINVATASGAQDAISRLKSGLGKLSSIRSDIGAQQNRLEHTIRHQENTIENTQQAESQIRDTDMSTEMTQYSAADILQQAGQAMLSQANHSNQGVLSLLQ